MRILVSPNSFKNSLDAMSAADAIARGLTGSRLACSCECFPVGDGGDGTAGLIMQKCGGRRVEQVVTDPLGRPINAGYGLINGGTAAVIEMADASGIRLLEQSELDPLKASSYGTGLQIRDALDKGVSKIIIGMGGSATVDGGAGILAALGVRFMDVQGSELKPFPGELSRLVSIDTSHLDQRIARTSIIVLCDVENPLLGSRGAAAVFAPQKGASPEEVGNLEKMLTTLSAITERHTGTDITSFRHGGTAGGAAAGLHAFLQAILVQGIDHFLDITGFDRSLEQSDLVITGEGSIDEQTLEGKAPFGVAVRAKARQIPVIGLAGKIPAEDNGKLRQYFDVLLAVQHQPSSLTEAMAGTASGLIRTSREIGNLLALPLTLKI